MVSDPQLIRTYFSKLGLEPEIADIYLALYTNGPQAISELSRTARVERTRIYRLIDKLMDSHLIEVETHYKRGILKAAPVANLHILIAQKEQELKGLQDDLQLIEKVLTRNSLSSPATRVQFYQGPEGAKQMLWNQTTRQEESLSILLRPMQECTGKVFFDRWIEKYNEHGLPSRSVVGPEFLHSLKAWREKNGDKKLKLWQGRLIAPELFTITCNMTIQGDVINYFEWKDGEIYGIEIYNSHIAQLQHQLFEDIWQKATPL